MSSLLFRAIYTLYYGHKMKGDYNMKTFIITVESLVIGGLIGFIAGVGWMGYEMANEDDLYNRWKSKFGKDPE